MLMTNAETSRRPRRSRPATYGRFLQPDPIGYGDGLNVYSYVGNDPINSVDPTGLREVTVCRTVNVKAYIEGFGGGGSSPKQVCDTFILPDRAGGFGGFDGGVGGALGGTTTNPTPEREKASCSAGSVAEIRKNLPRKGALTQIKDGASSYVQGVAWGATALAARVGLLGSPAQQQAINTNGQLAQAVSQMGSHPGETFKAVVAVASKYPLQLGSRFASGAAISVVGTPYGGAAVSALSAYGSAFKAAHQHPNAVAVAAVVGEHCR